MPFCIHCGAGTGSGDRFCAHCGSSQFPGAPGAAQSAPPPPPGAAAPGIPPPPPGPRGPANIRPNIAAMLCYIPSLGWIASVFFMTAEGYKQNRYVRFHALQGLFLFVASMLLKSVAALTNHFRYMDPFNVVIFSPTHWTFLALVSTAVLIIQIVGIVKTVKSEPFHIPVLGDLAERSMT